MNNPKVSVIIPNYNYENYLTETVESVLAQTYDNIEIVVVDDGSKDNSLGKLRLFGDKIKVVEQKNAGVSAARNNGVAHSTGEYIAFLDADDVWSPEKVQKQIECFLKNPELGLVHVAVTIVDTELNGIGVEKGGLSGFVAEEFLKFESAVILGGGSGIMVSRKLFDSVGGFDTNMSTSADWDFYYRITSRSEVAFIAEPLLLYRMHNSNMHGNIKAMEKDMLRGYQKAFTAGATADEHYCYGNLYKVLAGSYFQAGQYSDFIRNAMKSVWSRPANLKYFAEYPIRRFRRN